MCPLFSFADLDLLPSLRAALDEMELVTPTEIQRRAVPALLAGRSVVGVAETGSGKTLAYALPLLHALKTLEQDGDPVTAPGRPRAAVIVPTRELGEQVARVFKRFTHTTRLRVRTALGGATMEVARRNVAGPFEVVVATPGRLVKLLDGGFINLGDVRTLVFDEVDQMLDPGFLPDAERLARACLPARQMALFSATVSPPVHTMIDTMFAGADVIRSEGSHRVVATLTTVNRAVDDGRRFPALRAVLEGEPVAGGTLIFTNTREQCDTLAGKLGQLGRACLIYRGEMDRVERRTNLRAFRDGAVDVMVSTDLGARGLDIAHVGRVINYHLPQQLEAYLHRVGRTARAGRPGLVVNLVTERDAPLIAQLGAPPVTHPRPARADRDRPPTHAAPASKRGRSAERPRRG